MVIKMDIEQNIPDSDSVEQENGTSELDLTMEIETLSGAYGASPNSPKSVTSRPDPALLLNPKAAKRGQRNETEEPQNSEEVSFTGMGSMIERMYRVERREDAGTKRRKVETDGGNEEIQENKRQFAGTTKGGVVTEFLDKKREENSTKAEGSSTIIDLTNDDDEIIVEDVNDRQVCLGMIKDAGVHAHLIPTPRMGQFQGTSKFWPAMKVKLRRPEDQKGSWVTEVIDPSLRSFGRLDPKTSKALAPMIDSVRINGLRVEARLEMRKKEVGETPGTPISDYFPLRILLYAPRKKAPSIGRFLNHYSIHLITPNPLLVDKGFEVYNPHDPESHKVTNPLQLSTGNYGGLSSSAGARTVEEIRVEVTSMFDSLIKTDDLPEKEQDEKITTPLLAHQKQALYFMSEREKGTGIKDDQSEGYSLWRSKYRPNGQIIYYNVITGSETPNRPPPVWGGILADMMGLGKTLSILSLIVDSLDDAERFEDLVPPRSPQRLLITNLKATLLVCPLSTVANWEQQIKLHVKPEMVKYCIYHGPNRTDDVTKLKGQDMVITSYQTLAAEYRRPGTKRPLLDAHFYRVVLDEAHIIRSRDTGQSKAACEVMAPRRWAVTGTPIQNNLEDLGSLLKFLKIKPFDDKHSFGTHIIKPFKDADTEILPKLRLLVDHITLRRLKDRIDLPKRTDNIVRLEFSAAEMALYEFFVKDSTRKVQQLTAAGKAIGGRTYAHVLKAILRLRLICAHGRELLNDEDLKMAQGLTAEDAIEIGEEEDEEPPALTQRQVLEMFYLLRESDLNVCSMCNKKIGRTVSAAAAQPDDSSNDDEKESNDTIGYMTPCYHIICPDCIDTFQELMLPQSDATGQMMCPLCNTYVKIFFYEMKQSELDEDEQAKARVRANPRLAKQLGRYGGPHTKTKALMEQLKECDAWSQAHPNEPPVKSVIFSGWTSHLDLIEFALEANNFKYTRLDGSMTRKARTASLETFRVDDAVPIMLVTIGAGGLGLNLTSANKVFMMEPQFNPAAEAQAVERVHRLGQTRDVEITRYIMRGSFEEKMLELQRKKKDLADLSFNRNQKMDKAEQVKKKLEDLRSLFR